MSLAELATVGARWTEVVVASGSVGAKAAPRETWEGGACRGG